jgi:hypothetical protein
MNRKKVLRRCGRFTLVQAEEGFEWELTTRAGKLWHWNPVIRLWTAACRLSHTPEAATLGLSKALAQEEAAERNKAHRNPMSDEGADGNRE